jgi:hypothetical protein
LIARDAQATNQAFHRLVILSCHGRSFRRTDWYQKCRTLIEKPQPESGGQGLGLPSSGRLRNKALTLRTVPAKGCLGYDLRRGREAHVRRSDYAAFLHLRLQVI